MRREERLVVWVLRVAGGEESECDLEEEEDESMA